jgi:cytochrome c oxidase subunit 3
VRCVDLLRQVVEVLLGTWVFLLSEVFLFAGLFVLYGAARMANPYAFHVGLAHSEKLLGSLNTAILLASSFTVARAVHVLRAGRAREAFGLVLATLGFAFAFLGVKAIEWGHHFEDGVFAGGRGAFFANHPVHGLPSYFTLYYVMTGLHALHVIGGMAVLGWLAVRISRGTILPPHDHPLALGALYWHLVDVIWIFLWPLFYLTGGET